MMRKLAMVLGIIGVCTSSAFAQTPRNEIPPAGEQNSRADCQAQFRFADKDGNGVLSPAEAQSGQRVIPTDLALTGPITMTEFMDACTAQIPKGG
jgi:hypothetical protein